MAEAQTIRGQQISQEFHLPLDERAALWDLTSTVQEYHCPLSVSLRNSPPRTVLWSSFIARHLRCHRFFVCLSLIRGSLRALTNVAAAHHGWTANVFELPDMDGFTPAFFKEQEGNKKIPSLLKEKSEGVYGIIFYFSKNFLSF